MNRPRPRFLLLNCSARQQNRAPKLAEPKERPPGKTEDEDELEDDYDLGTKGEERGAIDQTKLYSPHCWAI